jgi:hypothetical protein
MSSRIVRYEFMRCGAAPRKCNHHDIVLSCSGEPFKSFLNGRQSCFRIRQQFPVPPNVSMNRAWSAIASLRAQLSSLMSSEAYWSMSMNSP